MPGMPTWSAPVRYAEVDGQGVVFNAHYLLYCDETMTAWCRERDLPELPDRVQLVSSTLNWTSGARWGETIRVEATCAKIGRTSFLLAFDLTADDRPCCHVETTYVRIGADGRPEPIPDEVRARLSA
jgi:acyl-CoA thioester hydrolase